MSQTIVDTGATDLTGPPCTPAGKMRLRSRAAKTAAMGIIKNAIEHDDMSGESLLEFNFDITHCPIHYQSPLTRTATGQLKNRPERSWR